MAKAAFDECRIAVKMPTSISTIRSSATGHVRARPARRAQ
jgi:hypothetical protein